MNKLKFCVFLILLTGLLSLLVVIHPDLIAFDRLRSKKQFKKVLPPSPALHSIQNRKTAAEENNPSEISYYRHSPQRSGLDPKAIVPLDLRESWRFENLNLGIHGASKASPAVDASGVYVGTDSGWFYAFEHSGSLRWKFHIGLAARGIHSTALLSEKKVCFGGYNSTFYCLKKDTGEVVWTTTFARTAFGASPLVVDGFLVLAIETTTTTNGFLAKLELETGKLIWQSRWLGEQVHSSPAYDSATNSLIVGANNGRLFKIDFETGRTLGSINLMGPIKSTPLVTERGALVTSWNGSLLYVDTRSGKKIWKTSLGFRSQSSPTLFPDSGIIVVGSSGGSLFGIEERSGKILWKHQTNLQIQGSALGVRESLQGPWRAWIGCDIKTLCALDVKSGKILKKISLDGDLTGIPVAFENFLYIALNHPGGLVKLKAQKSLALRP